MTAVSRWAKYLDIGESFSVFDEGRLGIQMQVKQEDVEGNLDLTSVGTGVSQLLPVIVMCVQAPIGSLLLIEQPELHLNPRVQQRLADFLLAIAQSGRHLIVETHSEYLISRLRRRVAEDPHDVLQDIIGIYFAKRVNGATTYDPVQTNKYGGIEEWPENFFDQATDEEHAILSAAVVKRRAKATPPD
jgi:predicted ATPase